MENNINTNGIIMALAMFMVLGIIMTIITVIDYIL